MEKRDEKNGENEGRAIGALRADMNGAKLREEAKYAKVGPRHGPGKARGQYGDRRQTG